MKLNIEAQERDVLDLFEQLDDDIKKRILESYVLNDVLEAIENQLKHKTDLDSWDTSGWRDCSKIREYIIKIQGLEPEFKKDLESKIRSLERNVEDYQKYCDWYFKVWHSDAEHVHEFISKYIGWL